MGRVLNKPLLLHSIKRHLKSLILILSNWVNRIILLWLDDSKLSKNFSARQIWLKEYNYPPIKVKLLSLIISYHLLKKNSLSIRKPMRLKRENWWLLILKKRDSLHLLVNNKVYKNLDLLKERASCSVGTQKYQLVKIAIWV